MAQRDPDNSKRYVILGGGPAGLHCADTLRMAGFTGDIVLLTRESDLPYDRTRLSKELTNGNPSQWELRSKEYLENASINIELKKPIFSVIPEMKTVITAHGDHIMYDKLLIATGS